MKQDYEVVAYMIWNLEDARDQITRLLEIIAPDADVEEPDLLPRFADLYGHINAAWNVRNCRAGDIDSPMVRSLPGFPDDIEPV